MAEAEIRRGGAMVAWRQCLAWPSPHLAFAEIGHEYTAYIVFRVENGLHRIHHRSRRRRSRYEVGMELSISDKPQGGVELEVLQVLI
jgi:hypothetical protein